MAARPADVFPRLVLVLLIGDHSSQFMSKQVQGSEGEGALHRPSRPSARPENDRKTTGFTKPPVPELNFGIEKVKKRYDFGWITG